MLINWGDLVPGDVLRYNPDFIDDIINCLYITPYEIEHFKNCRNKDLIVLHVRPNHFYPNRFGIHIKVEDSLEDCGPWWNIDENGLLWKSPIFKSDSQVFIIIKLKEENRNIFFVLKF